MTKGMVGAMNEEEQRDQARRLSEASNVLDFDRALRMVRLRPVKAQEILDRYAEMERREEERVRGRERRKRALIEDYG
jgi:hypothetical protein